MDYSKMTKAQLIKLIGTLEARLDALTTQVVSSNRGVNIRTLGKRCPVCYKPTGECTGHELCAHCHAPEGKKHGRIRVEGEWVSCPNA